VVESVVEPLSPDRRCVDSGDEWLKGWNEVETRSTPNSLPLKELVVTAAQL
jgi:hypothetical protein